MMCCVFFMFCLSLSCVLCVPNVASVSRLSIHDCPFIFSFNVFLLLKISHIHCSNKCTLLFSIVYYTMYFGFFSIILSRLFLNLKWSFVTTTYKGPIILLQVGPSWSWSYGSWIYNCLYNQCLSPLKFWVRTPFIARCTRYNIMW